MFSKYLVLIVILLSIQKNRDELHTFIRHGYVEGVLNLTEADNSLVIAKSQRGRSALHIAVLFANLDIIETLIRANSKAVNTPDNVRLIHFSTNSDCFHIESFNNTSIRVQLESN